MESRKRIGRYDLERCLGGGMATVYRAHDTVMDRTVAVKVLKEVNDDGDSKRRFLREAQVAAKLTHPNIVRTYDFGEDDLGYPYIVMEYIPGQDLGKAIKTGITGDLRAKLETAIQIAGALEYIHSQGIVHRDIKPDNICIADNGEVKLMDFGIAKLGSISMTQVGFTVGTPPYMSPEQLQAEPVTSATDIYSFGLLLYELIAGVRAFRADQLNLVFYKVLNEPVDVRPLRMAGATEELCELVARCTAKKPEDRPASFTEVRMALGGILPRGPRVTAEPADPDAVTVALPKAGGGVGSESRFWTRPRTGIAAGAAVLLVAGVVTVTLLLDGKTEDPIPLARQVETSTGTMFLVPAGPFLAGEQKQAVKLADFYIDQTEVTNAAYSEFCKASGRKLPEDFAADKGGHPVVNVSYRDAEAFAGWAGKRLPTSLEWEKAARGSEGSLFPWGDAVDPARANVRDNPDPKYAGALAPVTAFPLSASPFGPLNLVGNAWEFVNERGEPTPKDFDTFREAVPNLSNQSRWVKIRGGSFGENLDRTAGWNSASVPADLRNHLIGFRCVRDPAPSDRTRSSP